jgi:hypothetical protein
MDKKQFMEVMKNVYDIYIEHGARSNKNVNYFHNCIKNELDTIFTLPKYSVVLEYDVASTNSSKKKRCDIVVLKMNSPYIIFPVKIIKTNYKQNKNNAWENLTGELHHLRWANENIIIIPINVLMNQTPYLDKNGKISKFENITMEDIEVYKILTTKHIYFTYCTPLEFKEKQRQANEEYRK